MKGFSLYVILLGFLVMACGMSLPTEKPENVIKANLINAPQLSPAPVPEVKLPEKVAICGYWNIREAANPDSASIGIVFSGSTVTLTGRTATAIDGGKWVQVRDRNGGTGWMNERGICEVAQ